jgi:hypothetical protein
LIGKATKEGAPLPAAFLIVLSTTGCRLLFFVARLSLLSATLLTRLVGHLIRLSGFALLGLALLGLVLLIRLAVLLFHCNISMVSRRLF